MADGWFNSAGSRAAYSLSFGTKTIFIQKVALVDSAGTAVAPATSGQLPATLGQKTAALSLPVVLSADSYTLASNITLATVTGSTPTTVVGGIYVWDANFTGTSLVLQSLGSDGVTYRTIATLNASGTYGGDIRIGSGASVRVYNPNGTSDTAVYSTLS